GGGAALRILALLQDTAEFFDKSRAEAAATAAAAARGSTAGSTPNRTTGGTPNKTTAATPQPAERGSGGGGNISSPQPQPSGNVRVVGGEGERFAWTPGEGSRAADGARPKGGGRDDMTGEAAAVRVVTTCSTSDRGMLSLYERFVHVVARVQNTTGPDCFSLRVDPCIGTASAPHPYPRPRPAAASGSGGFAPGFTPWDGGGGG
ncbi:unnamed protein product, partial [Ectocarpus sp. 8 AP-2014]